MKHRKLGLALAILLLCTPLLFAQGAAEGSFDRTLKVSGATDLQVRTGSGEIHVSNGASGQVQIHAVIRVREGLFGNGNAAERVHAIEAKPPVEQSGNSIRIGFVDNPDLYRDVSISYEIIAPPETRLTARTGSGSEAIEGIQGPVDAQTGSGSLNIMDVDREVTARTGSGEITIDGVRNSVTARTGSGGIRANHVGRLSSTTGTPANSHETLAQLDMQTGSGSIRLQDALGSLRAHTGSGNIQAAGEPEGNWQLDTGSGGVTVQLPHNAGFDLVAHTGSGSIKVDHPLTIQGAINKHTVRGTARGGGPDLDIRTGSGGIQVE